MNYQDRCLAWNAEDFSYAFPLSPPELPVNTTEAEVDAQEATTVLKSDEDLAWLGVLLCWCSAAITCGTVYFLVKNLFF